MDGGDFLRELAGAVLQKLMVHDVDNRIGAGRYERSDERATQRNGNAGSQLRLAKYNSATSNPNDSDTLVPQKHLSFPKALMSFLM